MKITSTGLLTTFYVYDDLAIGSVITGQPLTGFTMEGKVLSVRGRDYIRTRAGDKYLYLSGTASSRSAGIPGTTIQMPKGLDYAVPELPEKDEWDVQSIWMTINTARLRERLELTIEQLQRTHDNLYSKCVTIMDKNGNRSAADALIKPTSKLIKGFKDLMEITALNVEL